MQPKQAELKKAFAIQTGVQALSALAERLPADALDRLVAKRGEPYAFLVELLTEAAPLAAGATAVDRAAARGLQERQRLLGQEGGLGSAADLGKLFDAQLSRQAIDLRGNKKQLFALPDGSGHFNYPVWQVHQGATLPGLVEVLPVLGIEDPMAAVVFFLQPDPRLKGKRPLDKARAGDAMLVLELARSFGEHGAL